MRDERRLPLLISAIARVMPARNQAKARPCASDSPKSGAGLGARQKTRYRLCDVAAVRKNMFHAAACKIGLIVGLALTVPMAAQAEGLVLSGSKKGKNAALRSQMALLDGRLATQYNNSARLKPNAGKETVTEASAKPFRGSYKGAYLQVAKSAAHKHGVPEDTFLRLIQQESGWNKGAVSPKGAKGLAQLMPDTANHLGVDIDDPEDNLDGGARYLRMMYDRFGSWQLALAAYNAGPGAVEKHGGIPPYDETQNYVKAILG
jgi:soluble lytic murein transglycosylase-like protein